MGLRDRLKSTVKTMLGVAPPPSPAAPAPGPRPPPPPVIARPAAPASPVPPAPAPGPVVISAQALHHPEDDRLTTLPPHPPLPGHLLPPGEGEPPISHLLPEGEGGRRPDEGGGSPTGQNPREAALEAEPPSPPPAPSEPARGSVVFASDVETSDAPVRNAHHRTRFAASGEARTVRVYNEAEELDVTFSCEPGEFILDAAERAGFELPYSCRSGGCLTCSGKVVTGTYEMGEQYVLEDEHQAAGFLLLCCTVVTSDGVYLSHQQDEIG